MKEQPLIGITYELGFQILNTFILLAILGLIIYAIYFIIFSSKKKDRIIELENKIKELENKINNDKI